MKTTLSALVAGLIFGLGLTISGMISPAKVLAFLDIFGNWDPTLAFVMGGALAVNMIGSRLILRRPSPLFAKTFHRPTRRDIDTKLVAGGAFFGIGWGLGGYCPGPAIASLGLLAPKTLIFGASMLAGMTLFAIIDRASTNAAAQEGT